MYKITIISGPNRGTSYPLIDGEVSIGRQNTNTVALASSKVSKKHCVFRVQGHTVTLQDMGSSNGTFVNGVLTKVKNLRPGDRISVGEFVFELVQPSAKPLGAAPGISGMGNVAQIGGVQSQVGAVAAMDAEEAGSRPPADIKGKAIWYFEHKFMPIFYALNLKHEWRVMSFAGFLVFILANLIISIQPLMDSNRVSVIKETSRRARYMAREIAERNAPYLAARAETKTDVGMVEDAEGVRVALLIDLESRIIAPGAKMNQYLTGGQEAAAAIKARDAFRAGRETGFTVETGDMLVAVEPVKTVSPTAGKNIIVAMALVSVDTTLSTPDMGELGVIYSQTLIITGIIGALILLVLYRTTLKPFEVLNEDIDKALKGDVPQVTHEFKLQELNPLWEIINSCLQRIPKSGGASEGGGMEAAATSIDEFTGPLKTLADLGKFSLVVFDADHKIAYMNPIFEEISGIRLDGALNNQLSDVARDQSLGALGTDLIARAAVGGEATPEDYDFSGVTHKVAVVAFGSSGSKAKAYALIAVKAEG